MMTKLNAQQCHKNAFFVNSDFTFYNKTHWGDIAHISKFDLFCHLVYSDFHIRY